ncbi:unnamed protein product [Peronospora destructor]|uniref:FYVE-type domain-containing protein n=1 Tax=Peronospora destructor TaxID=86335 RepID=A0AAV0U254_9STRA|nr:unnamed protein product [Peronospora destructor]
MGRNVFDFNIANSSNLFLSGKAATDDQVGSMNASFSSTASSSAESLANQTSATFVTQGVDMDMPKHSLALQHSRPAEHSSRGNRRPMTFTTTSSITGTNTTTLVAGGHQHHAASHVPNANATASCKARRKCSVCGKNFNPLRRRHYCRTCTAVICSSCSISRRVESTFEGAITVRMCVSCKLSSIASQDDFYDRIFSTSGRANPTGTTESLPSGSEEDFTTDRLSFASYSSGTGSGLNESKDELLMGTASSNMVDSQGPSGQACGQFIESFCPT